MRTTKLIAEIITLRAIALKHTRLERAMTKFSAEIITLRAIALKHQNKLTKQSYLNAEIITLRAIALKQGKPITTVLKQKQRRDHNATSYSTETISATSH